MSSSITTVFTIGHSTHPILEFISILKHYGVNLLADIRTVPRSRHNPQFNSEAMPGELKGFGIAYTHMSGLGGLRHSRKTSENIGWRNTSFRGYADYMQTPEFETALNELVQAAKGNTVAVMCAEAVPWRCHRRLVADALLVRGIRVVEIISATNSREHAMTSFARIEGTRLSYPENDDHPVDGAQG